jgi:hypothetical protein
MIPDFNPYDWYWAVNGSYWSSAVSKYVELLPEGAAATVIAGEQELTNVLRGYGLKGPLPSVEDVAAERSRRLAVGFDYDFKDGRGVHHIGTSESDLRGWAEVTDWMNANLARNNPSAQLNILTDTGAVSVTPLDWADILQAATEFRQPIWMASFWVAEHNPIPTDYHEDKWWQK